MKDEKIKISIIMPIHNTPCDYLRECLDSVFAQTFKEFEIICVDDCSDNEEMIDLLSEYKERYSKCMSVVRIDQSVRAAGARNLGLGRANGDYVIFLDSDDIFDCDMLLVMYESIVKSMSDVCLCNYRRMEGDCFTNVGNYKVAKDSKDWLVNMPTMPWNKLVRKEYLLENEIYFQDLRSSNDVYYSIMALLCTDKICYLEDKYLIDYRVDTPGSISRGRNALDIWEAFRKIRNDVQTRYEEKFEQELDIALLFHVVAQFVSHSSEESKEKLYIIAKDYFQNKVLDVSYMEIIRKKLVSQNFETRWFEKKDDFLYQLRENKKVLKECISDKAVWLYGLGKRGRAFVQWAEENDIIIQGAFDKGIPLNSVILGIKMFDWTTVEKNNMVVVATNSQIFNQIKATKGVTFINLEDYCPL